MGVLQSLFGLSSLVIITVKGRDLTSCREAALVYQKIVFQALLDVELEGLLRQCVHLSYEVVNLVLLRLLSVVGFD